VLEDARAIPSGTTLRADVCIIGAGAAGITVAHELARTSAAVVVLEAGGLERDAADQAQYLGEITGRRYYPLNEARLRYFGGTTNHWGGMCRPLDAADFESRAWLPHSGWPLTRAELYPYYTRAAELCELNGARFSPQNAGIPAADLLPLDPRITETVLFRFSRPTRFGKVYRAALARAAGVSVLLHANALELETDDAARTVTGVRAGSLNGNRFHVRARRYVVATGGIDNARLLLASNRTAPAGLGNGRDLVGRYFQDHLVVTGGAVLTTMRPLPKLYTHQRVDASGNWPRAALRLAPARQTEARCGGHNALVKEDRFAGPNLAARRAGKPVRYTLYNQWEQLPNPDSRVRLITERDALGMPRVALDWRLADRDWRTLEAAHAAIDAAFRSAGLGRLDGEPDDTWREAAKGDFHHMGTTRMHADAARGVVDAACRVHGVDNLYLAGSSVFTTSGSANPTLTIVALALRLAAHLTQIDRDRT
jgi:choline dehydrogenase-like flavoprotein